MKPAAPSLLTARLLLRRWRAADRAPFAAINADPAVMAWMPGVLAADTSDRLVERIELHFERHGFGLWAVERRADRCLLGFAGLQQVPFEAAFTPAVEIGWRLDRRAWGHGLATEAARAALDDAVHRCGIDRVVAFTVPDNRRSQRVMDKLGFHRDGAGDFDHPRLPPGHPLRRHWLYRWAAPGVAAC